MYRVHCLEVVKKLFVKLDCFGLPFCLIFVKLTVLEFSEIRHYHKRKYLEETQEAVQILDKSLENVGTVVQVLIKRSCQYFYWYYESSGPVV